LFLLNPAIGATRAVTFDFITGNANDVRAGFGCPARYGFHGADITTGEHRIAALAE
jgi:hypothetical protein